MKMGGVFNNISPLVVCLRFKLPDTFRQLLLLIIDKLANVQVPQELQAQMVWTEQVEKNGGALALESGCLVLILISWHLSMLNLTAPQFSQYKTKIGMYLIGWLWALRKYVSSNHLSQSIAEKGSEVGGPAQAAAATW